MGKKASSEIRMSVFESALKLHFDITLHFYFKHFASQCSYIHNKAHKIAFSHNVVVKVKWHKTCKAPSRVLGPWYTVRKC